METSRTINRDVTDDIDLLRLVEQSIAFFRKYKWVFLLAILLGLGAGYYFYRVIPKTYKSRLVVHSFFLTNPELIQIVDNWNRLLQAKEYSTLSSQFNCPISILPAVRKIKAQEIQQVFTPENPNGFTIDVTVTRNGVLEDLQKGLLFGFENSDYIRNRLEVKRTHLRELIKKTNEEITRLDSTKRMMENIMGGKGIASSSFIVEGGTIYRQLIDLEEKHLNLKENLQFTQAVQVLQHFNHFSRADGPKLIPWLIIGLVVFLSLAFLFTIFDAVRKKMDARYQNAL